MRGDARHPQIVQHVHLAEVTRMRGEMGEHLMLVVEAPAAGKHERALLRPDAGAIAQHETEQRERGGGHQAILRSVKRLTSRTRTKVISSMVMESTAMGPQSLLSRRSNMVTETVLVRAVKSSMVADSSRMEPMKISIQVATTPLRISGAVMSASTRRRDAPKTRPASSSSGWTDFSAALIC